MARLAMIVVRQSRMKSMIVTPTRMAAITRWNCTSSIERTMNIDWSLTTKVSMSRQDVLEFIEAFFHRFDHGHGVRAGLLLHDEADGVFAVQPGQAAGLLEGVFHAADVLDPDGIAVLIGDDQVPKSGGVFHAAHGAQHQFAVALVDAAAGQFEVLPHEGLAHVLDREVVAGELVGVDVDVDRPLPPAHQDHRAHAGEAFQVFLDLLAGDFGDFLHRPAAGDGDRHHRDGVEVELVDDRRIGAHRAAWRGSWRSCRGPPARPRRGSSRPRMKSRPARCLPWSWIAARRCRRPC